MAAFVLERLCEGASLGPRHDATGTPGELPIGRRAGRTSMRLASGLVRFSQSVTAHVAHLHKAARTPGAADRCKLIDFPEFAPYVTGIRAGTVRRPTGVMAARG